MSRLPRNFIKTSYFHVIVQGINKEYIFNEEMNIKYYIKIMYEVKKEIDVKIISYCIMNNHAHILIKTDNISDLSKYMQKVNTKYGIYYNKKNQRIGYVFRDRYKSEGIYSEKQLHNCISYIYRNPVKAKICKTPEEYPYSNIKEYKGNIENNGQYKFLDIEDEIDYKEIIENYLVENNLRKEELIKNKKELKKLVIILKMENEISFRKIEKELEISRETLRKLID